ncbi:hypothetical protein D8674_019905 [Pyrus ussuriensis x Pyrus communis]|uniref:Uncharacterized protein n=1 Tax=Pyrus ussuriensis x Pyrus communis TaxID=2448454 RepID=A0A5N5G9B8_9ROSA|nr:hypothetical protein D8674_019905 [Pyrus ussuriensis x Pyrus communis]
MSMRECLNTAIVRLDSKEECRSIPNSNQPQNLTNTSHAICGFKATEEGKRTIPKFGSAVARLNPHLQLVYILYKSRQTTIKTEKGNPRLTQSEVDACRISPSFSIDFHGATTLVYKRRRGTREVKRSEGEKGGVCGCGALCVKLGRGEDESEFERLREE